ncbi:MAG: N-acetylmuramoyl-L-alanine amidase [Eubacteriales bacterium]|nr:N-acetylmuramoyl-L-alanine amidase [Eubacteriales bacterium]
MKRIKKIVSMMLMVLLLGALMVPELAVDASELTNPTPTTIKMVLRQKTKVYKKRKNQVSVNDSVMDITKKPIFLKSGSYMGPAKQIFCSSSLKIKYKSSSNHKTLVLTYNDHVLRMTNGSKKAVLDGKKTTFGTCPFYIKNKETGKSYWYVPIKSVCTRLGLVYKLGKDGLIRINGIPNGVETDEPAPSNDKPVIVLDAGHGGSDSGALGNNKAEKNLTLSILLAAKSYFDKDKRFQVYYTRTSDTYPTLEGRCKLANDMKADAFVSIHINSYKSTSAGTETLYNYGRLSATRKNALNSKELATMMQKHIQSATGFPNRGLVDRRDLCVLNKTVMPACLMEFGFISNKSETISMCANLNRYGKAVYEGLVEIMKTKGLIK